jgi:hypothetical protein
VTLRSRAPTVDRDRDGYSGGGSARRALIDNMMNSAPLAQKTVPSQGLVPTKLPAAATNEAVLAIAKSVDLLMAATCPRGALGLTDSAVHLRLTVLRA